MNFGEKLSIVIAALGSSNAEISREGCIDPSLICRFRKGTRIPSKNSIQFLKLMDGICKIIESNGRTTEILRICGCADLQENENLNETLTNWLCRVDKSGTPGGQSGGISKRVRDLQFFGEKLSSLMNLLDVSNVRLARSLNVDASLISRYRNGMRTPTTDGEILCKVCKYLVNRAVAIDQQGALAHMVGYHSEFYNGSKLYDSVFGWLTDSYEGDNSAMSRFLEQMDSLSMDGGAVLPAIEEIISSRVISQEEDYSGITGFRNALKRFLATVAYQNEPHNIYIYSEQSFERVIDEPEFSRLWSIMIGIILKKGNSIKVIHNIDRNISEMFLAVERWFPLYMSGQIEPYYCRKSDDSRFIHTMLVAENLCAIEARFVRGTENSAKYRYSSAKKDVLYQQDQYKALLSQCSPFIHIFTHRDAKKYYLKLDEMARQEGNVAMLLSSPSFQSMPAPLLEKILKRGNFNLSECNDILGCHADQIKIFHEALKNGQVSEFVGTPDDKDLMNGQVPINLCGFTTAKTMYYTVAEYCEHLNHIAKLTIEYPNYNYRPLTEVPFHNLQILDKSGVGTMVIRSGSPAAAVCFQHPLMCNSFRKYLHSYNSMDLKFSNERINVLNMLLRQKIEI